MLRLLLIPLNGYSVDIQRNSENPCRLLSHALLATAGRVKLVRDFQIPLALGTDGLEHCADDGIVCLSSVAGEENAATRLRALLQSAFGADYNAVPDLLDRKEVSDP